MRTYVVAAVVSIAVHLGLASWALSHRTGQRTKRYANIQLSEVRRPKPPEQAPAKIEEPPKPVKKKIMPARTQRTEPERAPAPKPDLDLDLSPIEPPKVGISEDQTAPAGTMSVATGVTLDGELGTGTSTKKPDEPAPRASGNGNGNGTGRGRTVPIYAVTRLPKPRRLVEPEVPSEFRNAARELVVVVEVEIDAAGRVIAARIIKNVGFGLDEAALVAAKQTEFEPALVGTEPVPVRFQIPYRIRVRG